MRVYQYSQEKMGMKAPEYGYSCDDVNGYLDDGGHIREMVEKLRSKGRLVGFIGGPPCPDFLVGGKNRGRNGDNGTVGGLNRAAVCRQWRVDAIRRVELHNFYISWYPELLRCSVRQQAPKRRDDA